MVAIRTILIRIKTGVDGTDGHIYVGIHGREFYIDSGEPNDDFDDFTPRGDRVYICGESPSGTTLPNNWTMILNPPFNDPSKRYPLDTDNLDIYPVYLRFEPTHENDTWRVQYVSIEINPNPERPMIKYEALDEFDNNIFLKLGQLYGKYVYLHKVI